MELEKTHTFEDLEVTFEMSFEIAEADPDVGFMTEGVEDLGVDAIVIMGTRFKIDGGMSQELSAFIDKNYEDAAYEHAADSHYEPEYDEDRD